MRVAKGLNFSLLVFLGAQKEKRATTDQRDRYGEQSLCSSYSIIWFYCCAGIGKMADFKAPPSCRSPPRKNTQPSASEAESFSARSARLFTIMGVTMGADFANAARPLLVFRPKLRARSLPLCRAH